MVKKRLFGCRNRPTKKKLADPASPSPFDQLPDTPERYENRAGRRARERKSKKGKG